ncbi:MAG: hypothetical protein LBF93_03605 [Zoogloeaceae bacterium]|jgi:hypothetical protein|nr:hypothetical protein [Zoogloeaceae bacterium]
MRSPVTDNIYATDDYPREGCVASVHVWADGYSLAIFDPHGRRIEGYTRVKTAAAISRMLREWCEGKVPALHREGDHK